MPGTLRVAVPESTGDAVDSFTKENVTADNRETIAQTLQTVNEYLAMEPTADEREALAALAVIVAARKKQH